MRPDEASPWKRHGRGLLFLQLCSAVAAFALGFPVAHLVGLALSLCLLAGAYEHSVLVLPACGISAFVPAAAGVAAAVRFGLTERWAVVAADAAVWAVFAMSVAPPPHVPWHAVRAGVVASVLLTVAVPLRSFPEGTRWITAAAAGCATPIAAALFAHTHGYAEVGEEETEPGAAAPRSPSVDSIPEEGE